MLFHASYMLLFSVLSIKTSPVSLNSSFRSQVHLNENSSFLATTIGLNHEFALQVKWESIEVICLA